MTSYSLPSHILRPRSTMGCAVWFSGRILMGLALFSLFSVALFRVIIPSAHTAMTAISYPYVLNYGEGPLLNQAARLSNGENIYRRNLSTPPYVITNYPPLYMLLQAPMVKVFGAAFWYGRLISVISAISAAISLGAIIRITTRNWLAAVIAGICLITMPYISFWSSLARIDALALALSLFGLVWIVWKPASRWTIILAILSLAAAAYTRQTYLLTAPLAGFAYLWGKGLRTRAAIFVIGFGATILALFIPLIIITRGGIFLHLITANINALDTEIIPYYANELGRHFFIFLACAGIFVFLGWVKRHNRSIWWLVATYTIGGAGSALTISKVGSDVNYLFEFSAGLCLCIGALIASVRRKPLLQTFLIGVVTVQIFIASDLMRLKYMPILIDRIDERRIGTQRIEQVIIETDGAILADEQMGLLALHGETIQIQPFEMSQLARAGLWDQTPFLEALERGDYPVVLIYQPARNPTLRFERWTREMLREIYDHYRVSFQSAETTVYRFMD